MKRGKKRPKNKGPSRFLRVDDSKRPAASRGPEFLKLQPRWGFGHVDMVSHFGWVHLKGEPAEDLIKRLKEWEKMTWGEIIRTGSHFIEVSRCSKLAQDRLRHLKLDDLDKLLCLRVNARARVFGIIRDGVFHFLWWDPEHKVCPSRQRGT